MEIVRDRLCEEASVQVRHAALAYFVAAHHQQAYHPDDYFDHYRHLIDISKLLNLHQINAAAFSAELLSPKTLKDEIPKNVWSLLNNS